MISFPNAKINLGLNVTSKREDGFHEIESVLFPVGWCDILEILPSKSFAFKSTGIEIDGNPNDNLCVRAFEMIRNDHHIEPVSIHLHKIIPIGAGLGGGSSDGAFTIKALNELFDLKLSLDSQLSYAKSLGSDCSFFILNKACVARGVGDELSPFNIDLSRYKILLINPGIHINTSWAYSQLSPKFVSKSWTQDFRQQVFNWSMIKNDFETAVFSAHPEIKDLKIQLVLQGAQFASMSGSGSTVYGIFRKEQDLDLSVFGEYQSFLHE
jgi:4-diphosphocytidyl-2-C-methyl-D-erythritol kinase